MSLQARLQELRKDLLNPEGPAISTNKSYPFAIFQYKPSEEFEARSQIGLLANELHLKSWRVKTIDLFEVLMDFLKNHEDGDLTSLIIQEEKLQFEAHKDWKFSLDSLSNVLSPFFTSVNGYPEKVHGVIQEAAIGSDPNHTVVFLTRIGSLYPFYRTSSLLRFLDTGVKVPTIILYPGIKQDQHYLSFMGVMNADRDYRPRIY